MHADAEHNGGVRRLVLIGFGHNLLEFDSGAERIHRAGELDQGAVARQLDQSPTVAGQDRFQTLLAVFSQAASVPLSSRPIRRE